MLGTFIIDFQTVEFERDSKVALAFISAEQKECMLENAYALDDPVASAGWSFAKLFLSGEFADAIYARHSSEIDAMKGKKVEDKLIAWLGLQLKDRGCRAQIKMAPEMKSF